MATELTALREQLAEKELRAYELEVKVKELHVMLIDYEALQQKLTLANRNARVLEEENNNLQYTLRLLRGEASATTMADSRSDVEARRLISENEQLREELTSAKSAAESVSIAHERELSTLQRTLQRAHEELDYLSKEKMTLEKERDALRGRCNELDQLLSSERYTAANNANLWKQERLMLEAKLREVQSDAKSTTQTATASVRRMSLSAMSGLNAVEQRLLKEEVAQLEKQLKEAEEHHTESKREWMQQIATLQAEKERARSDVEGSDGSVVSSNNLLRALRDQVLSLRHEITTLESEQARHESALAEKDATIAALKAALSSQDSHNLGDTSSAVLLSIHQPIASTTANNHTLDEQHGSDGGDRDKLLRVQDELQTCQLRLQEVQTALEAKEVRCTELAARNAILEKHQFEATRPRSTSPLHRESTKAPPTHSSIESESPSYDNTSRRQLEHLQAQLLATRREMSDVVAASEQKTAIAEAKAKEAARQVDTLLKENGDLRARNDVIAARLDDAERRVVSNAAADRRCASGANDIQNGANVPAVNGLSVLCKDKRDCVDDVMRMLEMAWDEGAEAKAALQGTQDAALTLHSTVKEDELERLRHALAEAEGRLQDLAFDADAADRLRRDLHAREDEVMDLQKALRDMERLLDAQHAEQEQLQGKLRALAADGDNLAMENEKLRRRVAEEQRARDDLNSVYNDRLSDLNRQLKDIKVSSARMARQVRTVPSSPPRSTPSPQRVAQNPPLLTNVPPRTPIQRTLSQLSLRSSEEQRRSAVPVGAHLTVTVVELSNVMHNGQALTEPGYIVMKVKSIKEKYKTTIKELAPVVRFDEAFVFYLAQPNQDVITLHVFYKSKAGSREFHVGDACFSMASLYRGVPRQRIAPVVQSPGTKDALRSGQVKVILQTDDFGRTVIPTAADLEDERLRFNQLASKFETGAPERLHAVDVYLTSEEI